MSNFSQTRLTDKTVLVFSFSKSTQQSLSLNSFGFLFRLLLGGQITTEGRELCLCHTGSLSFLDHSTAVVILLLFSNSQRRIACSRRQLCVATGIKQHIHNFLKRILDRQMERCEPHRVLRILVATEIQKFLDSVDKSIFSSQVQCRNLRALGEPA